MAAGALSREPRFLELLFARRSVAVALGVFVVVLVACVLADVVAPADPARMSVRARLTPPGDAYWLGADAFGRDVLSRLLHAGRVSLTIGLGVALISSAIGIVIGLLAGFYRRLDGALSRLIDAMMAFPDILLAIALVSILGGSIVNVVAALSIVYAPRIARIVRASTLVVSVCSLKRSTISLSSAGDRPDPMLLCIASRRSRSAKASSAVWPRRRSVSWSVRSWRLGVGDRTSLTAARWSPFAAARAARARASVQSVRSMTSRTLARSICLWLQVLGSWASSSRHASVVLHRAVAGPTILWGSLRASGVGDRRYRVRQPGAAGRGAAKIWPKQGTARALPGYVGDKHISLYW